MTQIKNKKIILTILVGLVGLFSILITSVYPTSHSKFFDKNDNALSYTTKLYNLRNFDPITYKYGAFTNYKKLILEFPLTRNHLAQKNEKDQYIIEIPSMCSISGLTKVSSSSELNRFQTSFNGDAQTKDLSMVCNLTVDKTGVKALDFDIKIYEKINDEQEFLYMKDNYRTSNYYDIYPIPDVTYTDYDLAMPVDAFKKKTLFDNWIKDYVKLTYQKFSFDEAEDVWLGFALDYVDTVYKTDADLIKIPTNPLQGLSVTYNAQDEKYYYHLDENFLGYARTIIWDDPYGMFFTTSDIDEINKAFLYYLKRAYPSEQDQKDIIDYVNHFSNNKGISYLILPNADGSYNAISGFDYYYNEDGQLYLDECLEDYVYSFKHGILRVNTLFDTDMMLEDIKVNFRNIYKDKMSATIYESLLDENSDVLALAQETDKDEFEKYFMIYDKDFNQYLYIKVYSLVNEDYNFVKIDFIKTPENVILSLDDQNGGVKVSIKDMTIADLNAFINQLDIPDGVMVSDISDASEIALSILNATGLEIETILTKLDNYMKEAIKSQDAIVKEEYTNVEPSLTEVVKE